VLEESEPAIKTSTTARPLGLGSGLSGLDFLTGDLGIFSPTRSNVTVSGVFRQNRAGPVIPVNQLSAAQFWAQINPMNIKGYYLIDVDVDASTGVPLYSALFQSGIPPTTYTEYPYANLQSAVGSASPYDALVDLVTYATSSGRTAGLLYQSTDSDSEYSVPVDMTWSAFTAQNTQYNAYGYSLTNLAVFVSSGEERFLGVWTNNPENTGTGAVWVGGWNGFANQLLTQGGLGRRLVSMAHWEISGDRRYGGVWLDGSDTYDLVGATDFDVFQRKVGELARVNKAPVRIGVEHGYQPPPLLAASFYSNLDPYNVGYSYAISEEGVTTAQGGFGYARAPWEATNNNPGVPMYESTRMDVASTSKTVTATALFTLMQAQPTITPATYLIPILNGTLSGGRAYGNYTSSVNLAAENQTMYNGALGAGVVDVQLEDLLNMDSGLDIGPCEAPGTSHDYADNYVPDLLCVLQNNTFDHNTPSHSAPTYLPPYTEAYSDVDIGVMKGVVEAMSGQPFENYIGTTLFGPLGINSLSTPNDYPANVPLANVNCNPDLATPTRPLYYSYVTANAAISETPGGDEIGRARLLDVCGTGGLQMTAAQWNIFLQGLMSYQILPKANTMAMLGYGWAYEGQTDHGLAYAKNGGFVGEADVVMIPNIDTQVVVETNTAGGPDPQIAIFDSFEQGYPLGTFSIANVGTTLCLTTSGATTIVQESCPPSSSAPPVSEQIVPVDLGNGQFMLQTPAANGGQCVTVLYNDLYGCEPMIEYPCVVGAPNQVFTLVPLTTTPEGATVVNIVQASGLCLTVSGTLSSSSASLCTDQGNSSAPGQTIVQEPCTGLATQQFQFVPQPGP
jgi:CubicO group peptidase (beta-lactamase class C family)